MVLDTKQRYKVTLDEELIVEKHFEVRLDEVLETKKRYKETLDEELIVEKQVG